MGRGSRYTRRCSLAAWPRPEGVCAYLVRVGAVRLARWVAGLGRARRAHALAPSAHALNGTRAVLKQSFCYTYSYNTALGGAAIRGIILSNVMAAPEMCDSQVGP